MDLEEEIVKEFIIHDMTSMILLYKVKKYDLLVDLLARLGIEDTGGPFFMSLRGVDHEMMDEFLEEARRSYIKNYEDLAANQFPNVQKHRAVMVKELLKEMGII